GKLTRLKSEAKPAETGFGEVDQVTEFPNLGPQPARSGDPRRPASTTGHLPTVFPVPKKTYGEEDAAKTLVFAKATALGRKYQRDPNQLYQELWKRLNEFVSRNKGFSFESALDQVGREVETDLIYGRL